jgi:hypothetical protein
VARDAACITFQDLGRRFLSLGSVVLSLGSIVLSLGSIVLSLGDVVLSLRRRFLDVGSVVLSLGNAVQGLGSVAQSLGNAVQGLRSVVQDLGNSNSGLGWWEQQGLRQLLHRAYPLIQPQGVRDASRQLGRVVADVNQGHRAELAQAVEHGPEVGQLPGIEALARLVEQ